MCWTFSKNMKQFWTIFGKVSKSFRIIVGKFFSKSFRKILVWWKSFGKVFIFVQQSLAFLKGTFFLLKTCAKMRKYTCFSSTKNSEPCFQNVKHSKCFMSEIWWIFEFWSSFGDRWSSKFLIVTKLIQNCWNLQFWLHWKKTLFIFYFDFWCSKLLLKVEFNCM